MFVKAFTAPIELTNTILPPAEGSLHTKQLDHVAAAAVTRWGDKVIGKRD